LFAINNQSDQVKENEMGRACSMNGEKNAYRIFVGKPEGKLPLERPRDKWWIILNWILEEQVRLI
jgi:hypothetical protein